MVLMIRMNHRHIKCHEAEDRLADAANLCASVHSHTPCSALHTRIMNRAVNVAHRTDAMPETTYSQDLDTA
jgi:hypothetical protein